MTWARRKSSRNTTRRGDSGCVFVALGALYPHKTQPHDVTTNPRLIWKMETIEWVTRWKLDDRVTSGLIVAYMCSCRVHWEKKNNSSFFNFPHALKHDKSIEPVFEAITDREMLVNFRKIRYIEGGSQIRSSAGAKPRLHVGSLEIIILRFKLRR